MRACLCILGVSKGDAFCLFETEADAARATQRHRRVLGKRAVDVLQCCKADLYAATIYSPVLPGPGGVPLFAPELMTCGKLRGLPFKATEDDIFAFFDGIKVGDFCVRMHSRWVDLVTDCAASCQVIGIYICRDLSGHATGESFVEFQDVDMAQQAMGRNRELMEGRYIELFACSKEEVMHQIQQASQAGRGNLVHRAGWRQPQMMAQQPPPRGGTDYMGAGDARGGAGRGRVGGAMAGDNWGNGSPLSMPGGYAALATTYHGGHNWRRRGGNTRTRL